MKEWRLGWEHKFFLATLIASQVIGVISAFDCRFFIFHPECRGQYGKRSTLPALAQQQGLPNTIPINDQYPNLDLDPEMDMKILLEYCSRYVFAPICRGVTSKRATISPLVGNNHAIYDLILKQIKKQQEENKYSSEQVKEDTKDNIDSDQLKPKRDGSWDLNDLGSFTSFYRKRLYKRNAPYLDDLDTFTSFFKKKRSNNVDDLGLFTTFYKKNDPNLLQQQRNNAIDDLNSFTTFYKRDQGTGLREPSSFRRQALDDLEAFTTFMKKDHKNKRSPRSISREALRDSLDTEQ